MLMTLSMNSMAKNCVAKGMIHPLQFFNFDFGGISARKLLTVGYSKLSVCKFQPHFGDSLLIFSLAC